MLNSREIRYRAAGVFAALELMLGSIIQVTGGRFVDFVCFSTIALALIFILLFGSRSVDGYLVLSAMAFTLLADFCLVILMPRQRELAMIFFIAVQFLYFMRLMRGEGKRVRLFHVISRCVLSAVGILLAVLVLGDGADFLSIISIFYFANLLVNIAFAFTLGRRWLIFAIGLVCFALCDVFVGLDVLLSEYVVVTALANDVTRIAYSNGINLVWFFYVPAQTLIAISSLSDVCE